MHDLKIIGADLEFKPDEKLTGDRVVEAENTSMDHGTISKNINDYSKEGYLQEGRNVRFTFNVPESGKYRLMFRYSMNWEYGIEKQITINGKEAEPFYFWNTGTNTNWTVDGQVYYLEKGKNTIGIDWIHRFNLDQVGLERVM